MRKRSSSLCQRGAGHALRHRAHLPPVKPIVRSIGHALESSLGHASHQVAQVATGPHYQEFSVVKLFNKTGRAEIQFWHLHPQEGASFLIKSESKTPTPTNFYILVFE